MTNIWRLTKHAKVRMQHRALRKDDIEMMVRNASQISSDTYVLRRKDARRAIVQCPHHTQQLERLVGTEFIVRDGCIITCIRYKKIRRTRQFRR